MTSVLTYRPTRRPIIASPGPVGSVGDVLASTRLKHSNPDMPLRYSGWNSGVNEIFLGSNVSDGQHVGYVSQGFGAEVLESKFGHTQGTRTATGYRVQDLNSKTNMLEPDLGSLGDYDWRNRQATVYESNRPSSLFTPLPYGYQLRSGQLERAGGARLVSENNNELHVSETQTRSDEAAAARQRGFASVVENSSAGVTTAPNLGNDKRKFRTPSVPGKYNPGGGILSRLGAAFGGFNPQYK